MATTQYMLLVLPTPGVTNDFTGEQQEVAAFTTIDAHDHTAGKGTTVPTAGLNINADLPFAGFNASGLRAVRMNSQSSTLALLLDVNCIYSSGGNLYFNNGSGQAVQITSGATLSASSIGGISGLAAPASVAYSGGTFVFTSNTNIAAIVDTGPVIIRDTGASAKGITLQSPTALASAYSITLPAALPGATSFLTMTSAGVMAGTALLGALTTANLSASAGILGSQLAAAAGITRAQLASVGQQTSASSGSFTSTSTSDTAVTNLSVTLVSTGRPVMIMVIPAGNSLGYMDSTASGNPATGSFVLYVDGVATQRYFMKCSATGADEVTWPGCSFLYTASAASHTYALYAKAENATTTVGVSNCVLTAYEL